MGGVHARAPVPPSPHQRSSQTAPHSGIGAGTGAQGHRGTGAQGHRGTGAQGHRGTGAQGQVHGARTCVMVP
jgi:hypothetical protein